MVQNGSFQEVMHTFEPDRSSRSGLCSTACVGLHLYVRDSSSEPVLERHPCSAGGTVEHMEVSAQSIATAASIAERVGKEGGAALIIDYGQDLPLESSLQAIKGHRFVHPLSRPGEADLSCHVDFSALRYLTLYHLL